VKRSFVRQSFFSVPVEQLFAFHERPDAFRLLTPDFAGVEVQSTVSTLAPSAESARFTTRVLGIPFHFEMVHTAYEPPRRFVDEQGPFGDDLLARICQGWEAEARAAESLGVRTAQIRLGIVLSTRSGALAAMLPLFRLGLGGVLGRARPWWNWIHIEDAARLFVMAVQNPEARGPINAVAPAAVPNQIMARTLAAALRRPCALRYPPALMRLGMGEAADFASGGACVRADRALELGYRFFFTELEPALRSLLGR